MFLYHGGADTMVKAADAKTSYDIFENYIYTGEYKKNYQFTVQKGLVHLFKIDEINLLR